MQLPRVIIAVVFFAIGAIVAVPALVGWLSGPDPEEGRRVGATATPSGTATATATPSRSATPSPTRTRSKSPSPTPTRPAAVPVSATIARVSCPSREVEVTVRNAGTRVAAYTIGRGDATAASGRLSAGEAKTEKVKLAENRRTNVTVRSGNDTVKSRTLTANCTKAAPKPPSELPETGSDTGTLVARTATGAAAMLTGAIVLWYGGIWPNRKEKVFEKN